MPSCSSTHGRHRRLSISFIGTVLLLSSSSGHPKSVHGLVPSSFITRRPVVRTNTPPPPGSRGLNTAQSSNNNQDDSVEAQVLVDDDVTTLHNNNNQYTGIELQTEVSRSFLQYSLSIILGRALPDARDGLKPVHRRILYSMSSSQLSLAARQPHRKCARVVGEVLGKFHPHGDQAVYDALVRMAQPFTSNHPLVDGHGNFGSQDADPAAAMRYTECRLTPLSQTALGLMPTTSANELDPQIVPYLPNFDGTEQEPSVLPAKLPLLLLNGSSGIAVGMATNIPPHNLKEVLTACMALLEGRITDTPVSDEDLLEMIPAPDFPTGGLILQTSGAKSLYLTGHGGIVLRAVTTTETITAPKKQPRTAIIVTEVPYQTNKSALLEKIAQLVNDKKLDGIADLRDESDRDGIRIVLELKRDAVAAVVLNNLFQKTPLQTTFSGNFVALMEPAPQKDETMDEEMDDSKEKDSTIPSPESPTSTVLDASQTSLVPQRLTLRTALDCFLDFRFQTIRHKSRMEFQQVTARASIVAGLLVALANLDAVIDVIRQAPDTTSAKTGVFDVLGPDATSEQVDAILRLQLGQLTRLNKDKLEDEQTTLETSARGLQKLLQEDHAVYRLMQQESKDLIKQFGTERKSRIVLEEDGELQDIDLVKNSRSVIVVTRGGYIKRMPLKQFESQNRGTRGKRSTSDSSLDNEIAHCFTCNDHDTLLMVSQKGIAYGLRAFQVPVGSRTAKGQPIPSVLPIPMSDVITSILPIAEFSDHRFLVLITENGWIKKTPLNAFTKLTSRGLTIAALGDDDRVNQCSLCQDGDDLLIGSVMGKATRFESSLLRPTGRTSRGVRSMKLREGDAVADMNVVRGTPTEGKEEFVLAVTSNGFGKRTSTNEFRPQARGGQGVIAMKFKSEEDRIACFRIVRADDEILVITSKGIIVRQKVSGITSVGRAATGVRVQKLDSGDAISSVSIVPRYEEQDDPAAGS